MVGESDKETEKLKHLAKMRCPKCGELLDQVEIHDIPVERCPHCRGVWLDAGELELIAEREKSTDSWLSKLWKKRN